MSLDPSKFTYIYRTPCCGTFITYWEQYFFDHLRRSDGFIQEGFAEPLLVLHLASSAFRNYSALRKCPACSTFYLQRENEMYFYYKNKAPKWLPSEYLTALEAPYLVKEDYKAALNAPIAQDLQKELFIRLCLWWIDNSFSNMPELAIEKTFIFRETEEDHRFYEQNVRRIISLLEPKEDGDYFRLAELYRNISEFDTCLSYLDRYKGTTEVIQNKCTTSGFLAYLPKVEKCAQEGNPQTLDHKDINLYLIY